MDSEETFVRLLLVVVLVGLFIPFYNMTLNLDTSGWAFIGHELAAALLPIFPYMYAVFAVLASGYILLGGRT